MMGAREDADACERNTIRTLEATQLLGEVSDGKKRAFGVFHPAREPGTLRERGLAGARSALRVFGAFYLTVPPCCPPGRARPEPEPEAAAALPGTCWLWRGGKVRSRRENPPTNSGSSCGTGQKL